MQTVAASYSPVVWAEAFSWFSHLGRGAGLQSVPLQPTELAGPANRGGCIDVWSFEGRRARLPSECVKPHLNSYEERIVTPMIRKELA